MSGEILLMNGNPFITNWITAYNMMPEIYKYGFKFAFIATMCLIIYSFLDYRFKISQIIFNKINRS